MQLIANPHITTHKGERKVATSILHNVDCIEAMKKIEDHSVDLILTDPPYNLGNFMRNRDTNLKKMRDNFFGQLF